MGATYDDELPTPKDRVRVLLGDTDVTVEEDALVTDEHINAVLTLKGTVEGAVSFLADELIVRFANDPVRWTAEGVSIDMTHRIGVWQNVAQTQRAVADNVFSFVKARYGASDESDEYSRGVTLWPRRT